MTDAAPGTPSWLRARNDATALNMLFEHGALARNQLAELTGMSKPTAAQMVSRLEQAGLIEQAGETSGKRGPNAYTYAVRTDRAIAIAVDIREADIAAMVVDVAGVNHEAVEFSLDGADRSPEADIAAAIDRACAVAGLSPRSVRLVCIGVQAAISSDDGVDFTDTLPGWPAQGARRRIADALGVEVILENDVNLAAAAERATGAAGDAAGFALLWMGNGVGVAVDIGGMIFRGAAGGAGEIGYLPVTAAGTALEPGAKDITDLIGHGAFERCGGDLGAFAERVSLALAPVLAVLDPELVVLGGPNGIAGGTELASLVASHLALHTRWHPIVRASSIVGDPVLGGAQRLLVARLRDLVLAEIEPSITRSHTAHLGGKQ